MSPVAATTITAIQGMSPCARNMCTVKAHWHVIIMREDPSEDQNADVCRTHLLELVQNLV